MCRKGQKMSKKRAICDICGNICEAEVHHLIFGSDRKKADEDNLVIDVCRNCHTSATRITDRIHDNVAAEKLSKMLGQMMWERNWLASRLVSYQGIDFNSDYETKLELQKDRARQQFMKRYGRSFL